LQEHDRDNEPYSQTRAQFATQIQNLFENPDKLVYGAETANEALSRFYTGLLSAWRKHRNENIAVISHGTVISAFVGHVIPSINAFDLWNCLKMPDAVVLDTDDHIHFTLVKGCE